MPACHGLATVQLGDGKYQALLADRVAFTLAACLQNTQSQQLSANTIMWVTHMLNVTVEQLSHAAQQLQVCCHDWHTYNVGFTDTDPTKFVLLDWAGHAVKVEMTAKARMKNAMTAFLLYLDKDVPQDWGAMMRGIKEEIKDWFRCLSDEGPSGEDLGLLRSRFDKVLRSANVGNPRPKSAPSRVISSEAPSPTQSAATSCTTVSAPHTVLPTVVPSSEPTLHGSALISTLSPPTRNVLPAKRLLSPQETVPQHMMLCPATPDDMTGLVRQSFVGVAAISALDRSVWQLLDAWRAEGPMHGKKSDRHIPHSQRLADPADEQHGNVYNKPEGNAFKLLFQILLGEMRNMGLHTRMQSVPRTAQDPVRFHVKQSPNFAKMCRPSWLEMNVAQRRGVLNRFLLAKFSLDTKSPREVMVPFPVEKWKLADISWNTVWLHAHERDKLMDCVIQKYTQAEAELLSHTACGFDQTAAPAKRQ